MAHVTMEQVARRAGVSRSLVSLVMRGSPHVSEVRRARVLDAAAALGYSPNAMARGLASRHSGIVGVVLDDLHNPFFAEIHDGLAAAAERAGHRLLLVAGDARRGAEAAALESFLELRPDGMVLVGTRLATATIARLARSLPVVAIGREVRAPGVDSVMTDETLGARLVVEHLAGLGHTRIAHVDGGDGAGAPARRRGYVRAMEALGLERHARVVRGEYTERGGIEAARAVLGEPPLPTALFVCNDLAAVGAIDTLQRARVRVPATVSVVGYDNVFLAGLRHVSLTTVDQHRFEMGELAIGVLHRRIGGDHDGPRIHRTTPTLVVRGTSAQPSAR